MDYRSLSQGGAEELEMGEKEAEAGLEEVRIELEEEVGEDTGSPELERRFSLERMFSHNQVNWVYTRKHSQFLYLLNPCWSSVNKK